MPRQRKTSQLQCRRLLRSKLAILVFIVAIIWILTKRNTSTSTPIVGNVQIHKTSDGPDFLAYFGEKISARYHVLADGKMRLIIFKNEGSIPVFEGPWSVCFHNSHPIFEKSSEVKRYLKFQKEKMRLRHMNGDLYCLKPSAQFYLGVGSSIKLAFNCTYEMNRKFLAPPNWYIVSPGYKPVVLKSTEGESLEYIRLPSEVYDKTWNPLERFERAEIDVANMIPKLIVPTPKVVKNLNLSDKCVIDNSWVVSAKHSSFSSEMLGDLTGAQLESKTSKKNKVMFLSVEEDFPSNCTECYILTVDPAVQLIRIRSSTDVGLFYGVQSLKQLMKKSKLGMEVPRVSIIDKPRFSFRGLHLDLSRNFVGKNQVNKLIALMSRYKLNKLHLHLTDDEGWRLEIPGLPELTQVGARRCYSEEKLCLLPQLGSGPSVYSSGSGFLTVDDYKDILRTARKHHVQVIPEIDMPGHSFAAIKSTEARYKKSSGNSADFRLFEPSDDILISTQNFKHNSLNPCLNSTYNFIAKIMDELKLMHKDIQPLKIFHFGGDEVPSNWHLIPSCKHIVDKDNEHGRKFFEIFVKRVWGIAKERGLTLGSWEDGVFREGRPLDLKNMYTNAWKATSWERAHKLANAGYKVVLSMATHLYFDMPNEPHPDERGLDWATDYVNANKVFKFLPDSLYSNAPSFECNSKVCKPLLHKENIIGMQACLWTETVRADDQMDFMIWPRLIAMAERAWHRASWEEELNIERRKELASTDWTQFSAAIGMRETKFLESVDVQYRLPPPSARVSDSTRVELFNSIVGLPLQYKVNDDWLDYKQPFTSSSRVIQLRSKTHDGKRFSRVVELKIK